MSEGKTLKTCETSSCETTEATQREQLRRPRVRVVENQESYVLLADMPGVDDGNAEVTFEKNVLNIRGVATPFEKQGFEKVYSETSRDVFERSFTIPEDIDRENVEATLKNGVLTLTIPKAKEALPTKVVVKAG